MTSTRRALSLFLLAVLLSCGCASNATKQINAGGATLAPPDGAISSGPLVAGSDYRIGGQDLLEISVFGIPDLGRTVRVNSNGQISLPLIGGVTAGGRTIPELERSIGDMLAKTYLQNPQVSVFVKEFTSQRITLEGALKNPGIYPIIGKTSLLQAIATAGGVDPLADTSGVVVFRQNRGQRTAAVFDLQKVQSLQVEDPQVYGDDVIVVEQSGSKTALRRFIEAAPALALFLLL